MAGQDYSQWGVDKNILLQRGVICETAVTYLFFAESLCLDRLVGQIKKSTYLGWRFHVFSGLSFHGLKEGTMNKLMRQNINAIIDVARELMIGFGWFLAFCIGDSKHGRGYPDQS